MPRTSHPRSAAFAVALLALVLAGALGACRSHAPKQDSGLASLPPGVEAISLLGESLTAPDLEPPERAKRERLLLEARVALAGDPNNADALIHVARLLGTLGNFREAVELLTQGIAKHPDDARMFRHRGHRYITLRRFDLAERDLERAAELARNLPDESEPPAIMEPGKPVIDTLKQNIFYHLGLARYLQGRFEDSLPAWRECQLYSKNADSVCSITHWLYMTLRRLGRDEEARTLLAGIGADMPVLEYRAYYRLCLIYKGQLKPEDELTAAREKGVDSVDFATLGYGVGNWYGYNGNALRAVEVYREVVQSKMWPAFGRIGAEVELARLEQSKKKQ